MIFTTSVTYVYTSSCLLRSSASLIPTQTGQSPSPLESEFGTYKGQPYLKVKQS